MTTRGTSGLLDQAMARMAQTTDRAVPQLRNIVVRGRRTSIRLPGDMWDALEEIAKREDLTMEELADAAEAMRPDGTTTFTAAMRLLILNYWRHAALNPLPERNFAVA
ncbi:ribbon-helix-helix domain-containing protein [Lacibacterium aquatile]|uniref:Ribbon-helix-helix domain-containing protein n=1 Tax=Lacibacterium aquatile TaxID=1168082 RepID=A0ABW5DXR6_9PROT